MSIDPRYRNLIECLKGERLTISALFGTHLTLNYYADNDFATLSEFTGTLTHAEWAEVRRLVDNFYATHTDDDILALHEDAEETKLDRVKPKKKARRNGPGYIYLLRSEHGRFKIGYTTNIEQRFDAIRTASAYEVTLEHCFHVQDMFEMENALHETFAHKRKRGEWFELTTEEVGTIKQIKG